MYNLTSFLNSSALSLERMVIPRENIIEVARLAILQLLLVSADADGRRRRVDDNMIIEVSYSCDVVIINAKVKVMMKNLDLDDASKSKLGDFPVSKIRILQLFLSLDRYHDVSSSLSRDGSWIAPGCYLPSSCRRACSGTTYNSTV